MKKKRQLKRKVDTWKWSEFENKARHDGVWLSHWLKEKEADKAYPFEKVNYQVEILKYTDEEYETHLKNLNPGWSRKETDYLYDLCEQFTLRFIIIADRYNFNGQERTVEELKNRYYSCAGALLKAREVADHPIL